jgi:hypothetical protein
MYDPYVDPVNSVVGGIGLAISDISVDARVSAYRIRAFEKRLEARTGVRRLRGRRERLDTKTALPKPSAIPHASSF